MPTKKHKKIFTICKSCGMKRWKIGDGKGYFQIKLDPDDPFFCMARSNGYVLEHRYVMAKNLKRPLAKNEVVHHKNHVRSDNRIENLQVCDSHEEHRRIEASQIIELKKKVKYLEKTLYDMKGNKS